MKDFAKSLTYALFAPIVVWQGYEDMIEQNMKDKAHLIGIAENEKITREKQASDYEAMLYLHTASLAIPFPRNWYHIYTYLFSKYYPEQAKKIDVFRDTLELHEKPQLSDLKRWIYRRQIEAMKKR